MPRPWIKPNISLLSVQLLKPLSNKNGTTQQVIIHSHSLPLCNLNTHGLVQWSLSPIFRRLGYIEQHVNVRWSSRICQVKFKISEWRSGKCSVRFRESSDDDQVVRWGSGEVQVLFKSKSELDIGRHEICLNSFLSLKYVTFLKIRIYSHHFLCLWR